ALRRRWTRRRWSCWRRWSRCSGSGRSSATSCGRGGCPCPRVPVSPVSPVPRGGCPCPRPGTPWAVTASRPCSTGPPWSPASASSPGRTRGGGCASRRCRGRTPKSPTPSWGGGDGLRQRRAPPAKGGAPPRRPPDPLTWFGVLVPPSLRQAQGSFVQGVTVALEVAGLQEAVTAATTRYRALLRRTRHPAREHG
ncbi:coiled-coil domain-containing protein 115, partial [Rissa tridactyla]|uniref:coiled-coil domain-containing protein 115 n=1 Tax=Rissa tridactyla TaxID=75485 RepID=UPI0023BAD4D3